MCKNKFIYGYDISRKTPLVSLQNKVKKKTEKLPKLNLDEYNNILSKNSKILVLVGASKPGCFSKEVINKIKDNSSIVVLTESTSNLHDNSFFGNIDQLIAPIELLKTRDDQFENLKPELLITTGGMIISKKIKDFLRKHSPSLHLHVGENEAKDTYFKGVKHLDKISVTADMSFTYLNNWYFDPELSTWNFSPSLQLKYRLH